MLTIRIFKIIIGRNILYGAGLHVLDVMREINDIKEINSRLLAVR